jgi:hypothetical protein
MSVLTRSSLVALLVLVVAGCSLAPILAPGIEADPVPETSDRFPNVLAVELRPAGDRTYDVAVTISSPYDTPARYADGWRVLDPEGNVLGTHTLLHDHANEQPFTRTQRGLVIPAGVDTVTVEGRDQANGFGGATVTVDVPE